MRFSLATLEAAIADRLSPAAASRLRPCLESQRAEAKGSADPDILDDYEAARCVAAAFLSCDPASALEQVNGLVLSGADVGVGGSVASLDQADALKHPLLTSSAELLFPDALFLPALTAAMLANSAPSTPVFRSVTLAFTGDQLVTGVLQCIFGPATVNLYYGPRGGDERLCTTLSGDALFEVGGILRDGLEALEAINTSAAAPDVVAKGPMGFHVPSEETRH